MVRPKPYFVSGFPLDTRVHVGENASMECYELVVTMKILMHDFRWFKWENKPSKNSEEELARTRHRHGNIPKGITRISTRYYQPITKHHNNEELHGVRLNLYNVIKADEGYYSCVGCNGLGCSIRSARLTVTKDAGTSHLFCTSLLFYCVLSLFFVFYRFFIA